jgi:hypothetical protein
MCRAYTPARSASKAYGSDRLDSSARKSEGKMNRTRLIRQPGQPGTKRLVEQYGSKPVCVRYRSDDEAGKRYKTVELIVEESYRRNDDA